MSVDPNNFEEQCSNCVCWFSGDERGGNCQRQAPICECIDGILTAVFPPRKADDWCGDFTWSHAGRGEIYKRNK